MALSVFWRTTPNSFFGCSAPLLAMADEGGSAGRLAQHEAIGLSSELDVPAVSGVLIRPSPVSIP
jgi:hypothetical protein